MALKYHLVAAIKREFRVSEDKPTSLVAPTIESSSFLINSLHGKLDPNNRCINYAGRNYCLFRAHRRLIF